MMIKILGNTFNNIINTWLSKSVLQTTGTEFLDKVLNNIPRNSYETFEIWWSWLSKIFLQNIVQINRCTCQKNNALRTLKYHEKLLVTISK
jgi:hypothetical protein